MKKTIISVLLIIPFIVSAQRGNLYKSAEDYYNKKPVENIEWFPETYTMLLGVQRVEISKNGKKEKVKPSELGEEWASDGEGNLMRLYDKEWYAVIVNGAFCYYVKWMEGSVTVSDKGTYTFSTSNPNSMDHSSQKFMDYYSLTLGGEIKRFKDRALEEFLDKYGLKDKFNNEKVKREFKDSVVGYMAKEKMKIIKYAKMGNEKAAKQQK